MVWGQQIQPLISWTADLDWMEMSCSYRHTINLRCQCNPQPFSVLHSTREVIIYNSQTYLCTFLGYFQNYLIIRRHIWCFSNHSLKFSSKILALNNPMLSSACYQPGMPGICAQNTQPNLFSQVASSGISPISNGQFEGLPIFLVPQAGLTLNALQRAAVSANWYSHIFCVINLHICRNSNWPHSQWIWIHRRPELTQAVAQL